MNTILNLSKKLLVAMALAACLTGCAAKNKQPAPQMTIVLITQSNTNQGRPFYMVVRKVDAQVFFIESYQDVSDLVFATPPNPSVLGSAAVLPGKTQEIRVRKPDDSPVAVYFMFSEPGDHWKLMLEQPLHPKYLITLEENRIKDTEKVVYQKKGLIQRLLNKEKQP